jgi:hypothetical protein
MIARASSGSRFSIRSIEAAEASGCSLQFRDFRFLRAPHPAIAPFEQLRAGSIWRTTEVVAFATLNPASVQRFEARLRFFAHCVVRRAVGAVGASVLVLLGQHWVRSGTCCKGGNRKEGYREPFAVCNLGAYFLGTIPIISVLSTTDPFGQPLQF